jgi:predicted unusual protein kinase regulating ubiquinone biosynthesis (AarF/ABC1/UbiB family)
VYKGKALVTDDSDPTAPPEFREVAIKVIHPHIKSQIEVDLDLMRLGGGWEGMI